MSLRARWFRQTTPMFLAMLLVACIVVSLVAQPGQWSKHSLGFRAFVICIDTVAVILNITQWWSRTSHA